MNNSPNNSREDLDKAANSGADGSAVTSPFNYTEASEEERNREMAMQRATDKIINNPSRPIL
jgi:hypothetical protein